MRTQYHTAAGLDGFIAGPGDPLDCRRLVGGGDLVGQFHDAGLLDDVTRELRHGAPRA